MKKFKYLINKRLGRKEKSNIWQTQYYADMRKVLKSENTQDRTNMIKVKNLTNTRLGRHDKS